MGAIYCVDEIDMILRWYVVESSVITVSVTRGSTSAALSGKELQKRLF